MFQSFLFETFLSGYLGLEDLWAANMRFFFFSLLPFYTRLTIKVLNFLTRSDDQMCQIRKGTALSAAAVRRLVAAEKSLYIYFAPVV